MKNKESHVSKRSQAAESLKSQVMALFGWSELQYGNFKFEQGMAYLQKYVSDYSIEIQKTVLMRLSNSEVFWKWWKNHWSNRDQEFFSKDEMVKSKSFLQYVYIRMHDGAALVHEIQPNRIVLEESYNTLIQDLIEKEQAHLAGMLKASMTQHIT